jgi:hypothetical protein
VTSRDGVMDLENPMRGTDTHPVADRGGVGREPGRESGEHDLRERGGMLREKAGERREESLKGVRLRAGGAGEEGEALVVDAGAGRRRRDRPSIQSRGADGDSTPSMVLDLPAISECSITEEPHVLTPMLPLPAARIWLWIFANTSASGLPARLTSSTVDVAGASTNVGIWLFTGDLIVEHMGRADALDLEVPQLHGIRSGRAAAASTHGTTAAEVETRDPSRGRSLPCWR